jgi:GNAT superfamily N-acetyltransferase
VRGCSEKSNPFNQGIADRIEIREAEPGDHGWVLERHAHLFEDDRAWGEPFMAMIARLIADYLADHDPAYEGAWVAELDGERVGSVYCVRRADGIAQLRLFFVDAEARGHGVGSRLVEHCIDFAGDRGYRRMVLWTNSSLTSARRIYDAAGFTQTKEEPDPAFPEGTVAQEMWLDL